MWCGKDALGTFGVDLWKVRLLRKLYRRFVRKGNEDRSGFTLRHLWGFWSDSLGVMGTENRPELFFNHLTMWISHFMQRVPVFCREARQTHERQTFSLCGVLQSPVLLFLKQISISIIKTNFPGRERM